MKKIKFSQTLTVLFTGILVAAIVALAGCSSSTSSTLTTSPSVTTPGGTSTGEVTINLEARNLAFNMSTITVPAGAQVTVNFDNKDSGVPHNFAVYNNSSASTTIFKGNLFNGPATTSYKFTAPAQPGTYFFRCDAHPTQMTGQFIVQ